VLGDALSELLDEFKVKRVIGGKDPADDSEEGGGGGQTDEGGEADVRFEIARND
jgi:hypothetical protein